MPMTNIDDMANSNAVVVIVAVVEVAAAVAVVVVVEAVAVLLAMIAEQTGMVPIARKVAWSVEQATARPDINGEQHDEADDEPDGNSRPLSASTLTLPA